METHRQRLLKQAKTNVKTAPHPAAAKRIADRAKDALLMRAAPRGSRALARARSQIASGPSWAIPDDEQGAAHRLERPSFEVPDDEDVHVPPSFADLV